MAGDGRICQVPERTVMIDMDDFWVFGYGSLMWRPGFEHVETQMARLYGFHRALCVRSHVHRGTPDRPGLVLGLDRGGSCHGVAFRVKGDAYEAVLDYLRARELVTHVYRETLCSIRLESGGAVKAITYVVDRGHKQYSGPVDTHEALASVCGASGISGPNEDYVRNTVEHLRSLRIHDHRLEAIMRALPAPENRISSS